MVELFRAYNNILQVIRLLNNLCEDCLKIVKREKMPGQKKKKRALQRALTKNAKNAEISATCLKVKDSSQFFSSFSQKQPLEVFYKKRCS